MGCEMNDIEYIVLKILGVNKSDFNAEVSMVKNGMSKFTQETHRRLL